MKDALTRLRALQQELEDLHRTTARVLAESEELIRELEVPSLVPANGPSAPRRAAARRKAVTARTAHRPR